MKISCVFLLPTTVKKVSVKIDQKLQTTLAKNPFLKFIFFAD